MEIIYEIPMKYKIYRRLNNDNRAPSIIDLSNEYRQLGIVEANNIQEAARKWINQEDVKILVEKGSTSFSIGEVMTTELKNYIHTGMGIWATVEVI